MLRASPRPKPRARELKLKFGVLEGFAMLALESAPISLVSQNLFSCRLLEDSISSLGARAYKNEGFRLAECPLCK